MTGVEILTSSEVAIEYAFNWEAFWIVFGVALGVFTIIGAWLWIMDELEWTIIPFLFVCGLCLGAVLGGVTGNGLPKPTEYTTEYKVIISDQVSMTEFYECYKVIEQDGKIFTVREK